MGSKDNFLTSSADWVVRKSREGLGGLAHVTSETPYALWHFGYVNWFMWMDTSLKPVFYDESFLESIKGVDLDNRPGMTTVSLPFTLQGERYRAAKNPNVLSDYGPREDYPLVLMTFQDPIENLTGDEVLVIEASGPAKDVIRGGKETVWRLYLPGRQEISVSGGGKVVTKPQAEMTAADVVEMLAGRIINNSGGELSVSERDLQSALSMITKRSKTMRERWQLLEERLKFNMHLVKHPHYVAMILRSMIQDPQQEFKGFLADLDQGKIGGWGDFLNRIDQMPGIIVGRGSGVLSRLMYQGMQILPDPKQSTMPQEIPSSLLINLPGLVFFNTQMENYEQKILPEVAEVSKSVSRAQTNSVKFAGTIAEGRANAWAAADEAARRGIPKLKQLYADQGSAVVDQIAAEASSQMHGIVAPRNTNQIP